MPTGTRTSSSEIFTITNVVGNWSDDQQEFGGPGDGHSGGTMWKCDAGGSDFGDISEYWSTGMMVL